MLYFHYCIFRIDLFSKFFRSINSDKARGLSHYTVDQHHTYRVVQKTVPLFYFCDNFRKCAPILTIFSLLEPDTYDA